MDGQPLGFFLTWVCYGSWLHGDERGSIDQAHNQPGQSRAPFDPVRETVRHQQLKHPPFTMDPRARGIVHRTIAEVCEHRDWSLLELNVRTNHVHVVLHGTDHPDKMLADLKAWCTRNLRKEKLIAPKQPAWAEHGSTIWLWTPEQLANKARYVRDEQGPPLPMI